MTDAVYVDDAASWAKLLTQRESRGPGDMENAWRRLETRYGVPWRSFWALRYRPPKRISAPLFDRLRTAYLMEIERQRRLLEHEITITKAKTGPVHPAVRAAEALLGEDLGGEE